MEPAVPTLRYLYAIWGFFEITIFAGVAFGWGSLVYVLKEEGLYRDLCPDEWSGNDTSEMDIDDPNTFHDQFIIAYTDGQFKSNESFHLCDAQDARLNLVFSVTSSFYCLAAFGLGHINYKYGTRVTRLVSTAMYLLGTLAVVFITNERPWLIFPGMCFIAGGGMGTLITQMQITNLFPRASTIVTGFYVGGFEFSTIVFQMMKYAYSYGISSRTSFMLLGTFHLLTLINTFLFLPKDFIRKPSEAGTEREPLDKGTISRKAQEKLPPLKSLLFSPDFLLYLYWAGSLQFRFMFVVSSLNFVLEKMLGSDEEVSQYTNATAYILMGGLIIAPLVGAFYNCLTIRYRRSYSLVRRKLMPMVLPLTFGTASGVVLSAAMFVQKPVMIYVVFLLLIIFRAFIYTMITGLPMVLYPAEYYGFIFGFNRLVCAAVNLFQYVLFTWGTYRSFFEVNIFLLVWAASTFIYPLYQWRTVCKDESRPYDHVSLRAAARPNKVPNYQTFGKNLTLTPKKSEVEIYL